MQRAIVFLALVACASAQLFQQNFDYRGSLRFVPVDGVAEGTPFAGALAYLPTPELQQAIRSSSAYTQTIRPANGWILAIDTRFGSNGQTAQAATVDTFYLIVAATSMNSTYSEGDIIIIETSADDVLGVSESAAEDIQGPCYGTGLPLSLNGPSAATTTGNNGIPFQGTVSCLINESAIVARLNFRSNNGARTAAPALGFQNFQFIRRDRTIFGPTVFSTPTFGTTA